MIQILLITEESMMQRRSKSGYVVLILTMLSATMLMAARAATPRASGSPSERSAATDPMVLLGRYLVISHACGGCHGGAEDDPSAPGWLAGERTPDQQFLIGPCAFTPGATPCFHTHPRNLTPDNETGLGRFTERQIFNALRYGLRPEDTPDVKITSNTPGEGNYPEHPHMLAPPMPWPAWRHMPDNELRAIAAYLKRGLKPVSNKVAESEGPPDFWVSAYKEMPQLKIGPLQPAAFPTANEREPVGKP
jgi:mono/diheme cytochrome c family protein